LKTAAKAASTLGETLLDRICNTPLLRLEKISSQFNGIEVLAKAEWANPGGSVKDRAASRIVREAIRGGRLRQGVALLDATSGNTGIAYAILGAALKFPVVLCMPSNVSPERKKILKAYGAEVVFTAPDEGSDGAIRKAQQIAGAHPEKYFYADQYSNDANWQAHYYGTAQEVWEQTERRVTHFVAPLGTSGTFVGVTRKLKELNPDIQCISLQPDSPFHGLEGLKHMATAIVPKIYDAKLADRDLEISTEAAYDAVRRLARMEGLLVGISAGAALVGSETIARELCGPAVIVTVFPDSADKYLSERFWDE